MSGNPAGFAEQMTHCSILFLWKPPVRFRDFPSKDIQTPVDHHFSEGFQCFFVFPEKPDRSSIFRGFRSISQHRDLLRTPEAVAQGDMHAAEFADMSLEALRELRRSDSLGFPYSPWGITPKTLKGWFGSWKIPSFEMDDDWGTSPMTKRKPPNIWWNVRLIFLDDDTDCYQYRIFLQTNTVKKNGWFVPTS